VVQSTAGASLIKLPHIQWIRSSDAQTIKQLDNVAVAVYLQPEPFVTEVRCPLDGGCSLTAADSAAVS
jgi:hypothetical protein